MTKRRRASPPIYNFKVDLRQACRSGSVAALFWEARYGSALEWKFGSGSENSGAVVCRGLNSGVVEAQISTYLSWSGSSISEQIWIQISKAPNTLFCKQKNCMPRVSLFKNYARVEHHNLAAFQRPFRIQQCKRMRIRIHNTDSQRCSQKIYLRERKQITSQNGCEQTWAVTR